MNEPDCDGDIVITPETQDELITLLEMRWPDRIIPASELRAMMVRLSPLVWRVWVSQTGLERRFYNTREVAEVLWRNRHEEDEGDE